MNITEITAPRQKTDEPIRLAAYCRVSSDSEDQLHSFAAQIRYYGEYTKKHPEYRLVDIYADEGLSGTDMKKRDEQNRMIRDCKKGKIDRIIVKSVSRFARNTEELLVTLRFLKEIGVSVYFEEQGIDTDKLNMEMIVTFPGMAAQQESVSISGNMRWSYQKRMQSGEFNCCYPAYGFQMCDGQLVPKESEMQVVRKIFNLYLQGMGTQSIANLLNKEGVPRRYGKDKWYAKTIHYILNNERYMGDALLQKSFTTETLPFRKVMNIGQKPQYYVENSNPAIVSRENYGAAQKLVRARKNNHAQRQMRYLLSGKLRCPECGRAFRRQVTHGTAYWLCGGASSGKTDCESRRVREEMVYEAFACMSVKLQDNRKSLLGTLIRQIEAMQNRTSETQETVKRLDKEIADLNARNLIITRLHTNGVLNAAAYSAQTAEIGNKINELRIERRRKLAEDENDEWLEQIRELNSIMEGYLPTGGFDEELFGQIVDSITVNDNTQITFKLTGGIELTEEIDEKGRCKRK